jgi:hypothetical protein
MLKTNHKRFADFQKANPQKKSLKNAQNKPYTKSKIHKNSNLQQKSHIPQQPN